MILETRSYGDPSAPVLAVLHGGPGAPGYPAAFAQIEVPVLMLHGDHDPHPGRLIRDSLAPHLSQLEYVEFERCGHYLWLEKHAREPLFARLGAWLEAS